MKTPILILTLAGLVLSACVETSKRVRFDGEFYRSRVNAASGDRHNFVVSVGPISRGVNGAREALRYEGTLYCVGNFGTSDILWQSDPVTGPVQALSREGNRLVARGRCREWR